MDASDIGQVYRELGYTLGWTFMMTPENQFWSSTICLVGLNPGGAIAGEELWSCEDGNAYYVERWAKDGSQYSPLQLQVARMFELLGKGPDDYAAAQFVPFRSGDWEQLANKEAALAFSRLLWQWAMQETCARLFICLGEEATSNVADIVGARLVESCDCNWGRVKINRYVAHENHDAGKVVVGLPHLSRYGIFGRAGGASVETEKCFVRLCQPDNA